MERFPQVLSARSDDFATGPNRALGPRRNDRTGVPEEQMKLRKSGRRSRRRAQCRLTLGARRSVSVFARGAADKLRPVVPKLVMDLPGTDDFHQQPRGAPGVRVEAQDHTFGGNSAPINEADPELGDVSAQTAISAPSASCPGRALMP